MQNTEPVITVKDLIGIAAVAGEDAAEHAFKYGGHENDVRARLLVCGISGFIKSWYGNELGNEFCRAIGFHHLVDPVQDAIRDAAIATGGVQ